MKSTQRKAGGQRPTASLPKFSALALALTYALGAQAQQNSAEEIVITARNRAEVAQDVPLPARDMACAAAC